MVARHTILLVDDDDAVRNLLARVLKSRGYEVLEAASGEQAQALFQQHQGPVHLLVCDVLMPGVSGPDLAARLAETTPDLRMLLMSGNPNLEPVIKDRHTSAEFIGKPFSPQQLVANVQHLLAS